MVSWSPTVKAHLQMNIVVQQRRADPHLCQGGICLLAKLIWRVLLKFGMFDIPYIHIWNVIGPRRSWWTSAGAPDSGGTVFFQISKPRSFDRKATFCYVSSPYSPTPRRCGGRRLHGGGLSAFFPLLFAANCDFKMIKATISSVVLNKSVVIFLEVGTPRAAN